MQRGTIIKHHGAWSLRYYETVLKDGKPIRKKSFRRLAPVSPEYPNKRSVLLLAEKILAPVNTGTPAAGILDVSGRVHRERLPAVRGEGTRPGDVQKLQEGSIREASQEVARGRAA
jgi:hypothetical protein